LSKVTEDKSVFLACDRAALDPHRGHSVMLVRRVYPS